MVKGKLSSGLIGKIGYRRVNGPLMNLPAFGEAYACKAPTEKAPSPMVATDPIRIWP